MNVLKREDLWKIKYGATVHVFRDPWLYTKEGFKMEPPPNQGTDHELKVG